MLSLAPAAAGVAAEGLAPVAAVRPVGQKGKPAVAPASALRHPVLWASPRSISGLDLLHGPGGKQTLPDPPFVFEQEIPGTRTPTFEVHDGAGRKWTVHLGQDARAQVAASRLLWAVGYFSDADYVLWKANVSGLHLRSGRRYLYREPRASRRSRRHHLRATPAATPAGVSTVEDARFSLEIPGQKDLGIWRWRRNPFDGTREMNGLRVMMALLNCWDLSDSNNQVIDDPGSGSQFFRVSGIGASLGKPGSRLFHRSARPDPRAYARSKFIVRRTPAYVDFATPSRSFSVFSLFHRGGGESTWVGRRIPREDVRWIAALLRQLSHQQIEEAFWAAGYSVNEVNLYADVVQGRIDALSDI